MFVGSGLVGLVILALWAYCVFDVISTDDALARNLPKIVWLLIVIFVPPIGPIAWLLLGRPENAGPRPGDTTSRRRQRPLGPDDSPEFLAGLDGDADRLRKWEEDLKRREDELRRRQEGDS